MKPPQLRPQLCRKCGKRLGDFAPRIVRAGPKDPVIGVIKCHHCKQDNPFHLLNAAA